MTGKYIIIVSSEQNKSKQKTYGNGNTNEYSIPMQDGGGDVLKLLLYVTKVQQNYWSLYAIRGPKGRGRQSVYP